MSSTISGRVVNASPLIYLTEVGLLDVRHEPHIIPVLVPEVVMSEVDGLRPAVLAVLASG